MNNEEFISFCGKHQNNFSILSLNIQSLRAKFNEFELLVETTRNKGCKLSIICLQETWLTENIFLTGLQMEGYELIVQPAGCNSDAGLTFYLHTEYTFDFLELHTDSTFWKSPFIKITGKNLNKSVIVGNIYRPPRNQNHNYQSFISDIPPILSALNTCNSKVILAGDHNIDSLKIASKPIFCEFLDTVNLFGFYPQITLPTRLAERSGSLIDNFFCKLSPKICNSSTCVLTSKLSDHFPFYLNIENITHIKPSTNYIFTCDQSSEALMKFKEEMERADLVDKVTNSQSLDPNINYKFLRTF